jgi:hypothetical protein
MLSVVPLGLAIAYTVTWANSFVGDYFG